MQGPCINVLRIQLPAKSTVHAEGAKWQKSLFWGKKTECMQMQALFLFWKPSAPPSVAVPLEAFETPRREHVGSSKILLNGGNVGSMSAKIGRVILPNTEFH